MNAPATNKPVKPVNKAIAKPVNAKPNTSAAKPAPNQQQTINQLRQEINTLTKTVKDMQKKPENQPVLVMVSRVLHTKFNAYLVDCNRSAGATVTLSELICEAMDLYLWAEEDNKRIEAEAEKAEAEKSKAK